MSVACGHAVPARGLLPALGWACFLGSSWTWVIAIFFPALLLRDYGLWGWVVFAVPNVLGAATMGFVVNDPQKSRRIVARHTAACRWFSDITIAYHVFAVLWVFDHLFGPAGVPAVAAVLILIAVGAQQRSGKGLLIVSCAVTAVSVVAFGFWLTFLNLTPLGTRALAPIRLPVPDLVWLAPAVASGFLLCPYLDLTFHHARQCTDAATGKIAFSLGFGVVFLAMIVFSLSFAGELLPVLADSDRLALPPRWTAVLGGHMCVQVAFTLWVHMRLPRAPLPAAGWVTGIVVVPCGLAVFARLGCFDLLGPLSGGEVVYRCFLIFYGLVFPAYVGLCMIPTWRPVSRRVKVGIWAVAVLTGAPAAYGGFVAGKSEWIIASMIILVAARVVAELMPASADNR